MKRRGRGGTHQSVIFAASTNQERDGEYRAEVIGCSVSQLFSDSEGGSLSLSLSLCLSPSDQPLIHSTLF